MAGTLTFDIGAVKAEIARVLEDSAWSKLYDLETGPALWLVGDQGVYLMGNHAARKVEDGVVYAQECDPTKLEFDDWWEAKREIFGGDDGVEPINVSDLQRLIAAVPKATSLFIDLTPDSFELRVE